MISSWGFTVNLGVAGASAVRLLAIPDTWGRAGTTEQKDVQGLFEHEEWQPEAVKRATKWKEEWSTK